MTAGDWSGITGLNEVPLGVAAQAYARAEIPVFPLFGAVQRGEEWHCECPAGADCTSNRAKHPRVQWTHAATVDVQQVAEWWDRWPNSNIGIPTGMGLWVVLDFDIKEIKHGHLTSIVDGEAEFGQTAEREIGPHELNRLLETSLQARTGGGGKHLVLRDPGGIKKVTRWLPAVDIQAGDPERGGRGYIVAAPSRHVSGRRYAWLNEHAPGVAHERLVSLLKTAESTAANTDSAAVGEASYDYREAKRVGPGVGQRDDFFNRYTFELRRRGWSKVDMTTELRRLWDLTPGGGALTPEGYARDAYRWESVLEKIERVWRDVQPDPQTREPVADELVDWARAGQSSGDGAASDDDSPAPPQPPERMVNEPPQSAELATELGTALRLARVLGDRVRYVHGMGWIVWNGLYWQLDESKRVVHLMGEVIGDIRRQAERSDGDEMQVWTRWALACESAGRIFSILRLAESIPSISLLPTQLDADPWLLVTQSGTLDLKTGLLRPDEDARDAYCTKTADVKWDPDADCPHWKEHVRLVASRRDGTPDVDLEMFLMRWAGYTLTGLVDEQKFAFLYGDGNNGKNVFIETLMRIMGTYAITGSAKLLTGTGQEHETVIADLAGPRLVFVDETPKGRINEARVKQLTGTSRIRARRIARDSFEFDAKFKLWIAGNHKPRVSDTSEGLWRRLDLIPFDVVIPADKRVRNYAELLADNEGPGILRLAVEGLKAYRELGLAQPTRVDTAKQVYRDEENLFGQFVSETFVSGVEHEQYTWHPNPLIHGLYEAWCMSNGVRYVQSMQQLSDDLERNHFKREPKTKRIRLPMGGARVVRGWWGPPVAVEVPTHLAWTP